MWIDREDRAVDGGPAPHLDCRPAREDEREELADVLGAVWLEAPLEERARTLAVTDLVPRHLRDVRERRLPELDKVESAVKERGSDPYPEATAGRCGGPP